MISAQTTTMQLDMPALKSSVEKKNSLFFSALPKVVQNRIPVIPSIRRTISDYTKATESVYTPEGTVILPESPPPEYTSRPGSAGASPGLSIHNPFEECGSIREQSSLGTPPAFNISEGSTGINWKYANQGASLARQAYAESRNLADRDDETATFARQLYVHGMTYLLRGLPSDLTREEAMSLQTALPPSLVAVQNEPCNHTTASSKEESTDVQEPPPYASLLHRITALAVVQVFVMAGFLAPYVKLYAAQAYQFEREHKITQKMVNNGIMAADVVRRRSLQFTRTICQMNNGVVGEALNGWTTWWVRGLTGGLQQGIVEGVSMMGGDGRKPSAIRI